MTNRGVFQGYTAGSTFKTTINIIHHINKLQKKKNMIISTNRKNHLTKFNTHSK